MTKIEQAMFNLADAVEFHLKNDKSCEYLFEKFLSAKYSYIITDWELKRRTKHGLGGLLPVSKYAINIVPKYVLYSDFAVWLSNTAGSNLPNPHKAANDAALLPFPALEAGCAGDGG